MTHLNLLISFALADDDTCTAQLTPPTTACAVNIIEILTVSFKNTCLHRNRQSKYQIKCRQVFQESQQVFDLHATHAPLRFPAEVRRGSPATSLSLLSWEGEGGGQTVKTITIVEFFSIFMNEILFIEIYYFISIIVSFS